MVKKKTRTLALLMVLAVIAAIFAGCGGAAPAPAPAAPAPAAPAPAAPEAPASPAEPIKIGLSLQGITPYNTSFVAALEENIARVKADGVEIELTVVEGNNDPAQQIKQCENFVQQGMDVVFLNPISYDGCVPAVEACVAAGVPILTVISKVANQDQCVSYCGSEHYDSGVMVAENAIKDNGESFKCVILEGVMGLDPQIERMRGFREVFANYPNIEILDFQTGNWDRAEAMKIVENWIQGGREFDVILSENDNMALGALEALKAANMTDIPVYGVDGDNDALIAVKEGTYAGTALMSAMGQATHAIDYAIALMQGNEGIIEKSPSIPFVWINKDNVDEYLK
jgi:ABC-type sugar transport system substrate-binding protein